MPLSVTYFQRSSPIPVQQAKRWCLSHVPHLLHLLSALDTARLTTLQWHALLVYSLAVCAFCMS